MNDEDFSMPANAKIVPVMDVAGLVQDVKTGNKGVIIAVTHADPHIVMCVVSYLMERVAPLMAEAAAYTTATVANRQREQAEQDDAAQAAGVEKRVAAGEGAADAAAVIDRLFEAARRANPGVDKAQ